MRRARCISKSEIDDPLIALSGTSLYVYLILLKARRPLSVREVQRLAGFRSPNSARHHLEKLVEMGFAEKTYDGYVAVRPKSSLISLFIFFRGLFIPKMLFYAIFSTLLLIAYLVMRLSSLDIYTLVFLTSISILLWIDTVNLISKGRMLMNIAVKKER